MRNALIVATALTLGAASCDTKESHNSKPRAERVDRDFAAMMQCADTVRERLKGIEIDPEDPFFPEMVEVDSQVRDSMQRACEDHHQRTGEYPTTE